MNKKQRLLSWFKANRVFAAVCILECLVLLVMCAWLTRPAVRVDVEPESFLALHKQNTSLSEEDGSLVIADPTGKGKEAEYISDFYSISTGAYIVTVEYDSVTNPEEPSYSMSDQTAVMGIRSFTNDAAVLSDDIRLRDGKNTVTTRLWIKPEGRIKDLQLTIAYTGIGQLTLKSVTIQEHVIWRWVMLVGCILLFGLLDLLYCLFLSRKGEGFLALAYRYRYECCLAAIVLVASMPLFTNFMFNNHDQEFHLCRIGALAEEIARGQIPVRMQNGMLNGYGYTSPLYYCDLFLYIPALLYLCMMPLVTAYNCYVFIMNAATCIIAYNCFRRITGSKAVGVGSSAIYTLALYRLTCIYIRGAVGEYTAMTFLPLIVLAMWNIYSKPKGEKIVFREYLPLALGVACIAMCHVLTFEMTVAFLVGIALCLLKKTFQPQRILAILKAAAIVVGLSLWFTIPMLESMGSMSIWGNQLHVIPKLQSSGLYPIQLFNPFPSISSDHTQWGMEGEMPLSLGLSLIAAVLMCIYMLLKRQSWGLEENKQYKLMRAGLFTLIAAAVLSLYCFPWDSVENWLGPNVAHYLTMFQFSYRFLTLMIIAGTTLFAATLLLV